MLPTKDALAALPEPLPAPADGLQFRSFWKECVVGNFACGVPDIDKHFKSTAAKFHGRFQERLTIAHRTGNANPVGFYALACRSEKYDLLDRGDRKAHWKDAEFPAVHLSFLAVHKNMQRNGFGTLILMDAMRATYDIARVSGLYGMTLTALDTKTAEFYLKLGFRPYGGSSDMPKLFLPIDTLVDLFEEEP